MYATIHSRTRIQHPSPTTPGNAAIGPTQLTGPSQDTPWTWTHGSLHDTHVREGNRVVVVAFVARTSDRRLDGDADPAIEVRVVPDPALAKRIENCAVRARTEEDCCVRPRRFKQEKRFRGEATGSLAFFSGRPPLSPPIGYGIQFQGLDTDERSSFSFER